jgi:NAD(P)-dependent dehydrogenase (short-subunit alcohol dehydrogenase family)
MKRRDATVAVIGAGDFIGAAITRKFARALHGVRRTA